MSGLYIQNATPPVNYQSPGLSAGFDGYDIPFQNYITSEKLTTGTLHFNSGRAVFAGVEAEATKRLVCIFRFM